MKIHPLTYCVLGVLLFTASASAFNYIDPWLGVLMYVVSVVSIVYGANGYFNKK